MNARLSGKGEKVGKDGREQREKEGREINTHEGWIKINTREKVERVDQEIGETEEDNEKKKKERN